MKVTINEYKACTSIDLEAESMSEAAQLTRLGMNSKRELHYLEARAHQDGTFSASVSIFKIKKDYSNIPKRTR